MRHAQHPTPDAMTATLPIALLQRAANPQDEDHLPAAIEDIRQAAADGARVIVLPELFRGPYFCREMDPRHFDRAEPLDGETVRTLQGLAQSLEVVLVVSFFEACAPGLAFNSCVVLDVDGRIAGHFRKAHIPDDPLYYEKFYFTPGDTPWCVAPTRWGRIGVLICWDQWYPEAARLTAMHGADVIVYPTAIGTIDEEGPEEHARQQDAWITVQRGHAIANGVFVAAINRVGREQELTFWGRSFVAGPQGELLATASPDTPEILHASLDLQRLQEVRRMWPFFRDRRIDAYGDLTRRWLSPNAGRPS